MSHKKRGDFSTRLSHRAKKILQIIANSVILGFMHMRVVTYSSGKYDNTVKM